MKDAARKAAFAARKAAHTGDDGALARALTEALTAALAPFSGQVLAGYWPIRTEADPRPALLAHDGPLCLPVVPGPAQPLVFRRWHAEAAMEPGAYGAAIPADPVELVPQVLIVPLLAFDARGYRLGYGGGFYDRTLEGLRARGPVCAIGFAYGAQEVAQVPTEPTDQPLDLIVTEAGVRRIL
ncbi:5-formyltetrahydrofolate cyclo-ligase [Thioclava sp. BHET1]|nr:5-formyltetrahydrofolate cyclo-ligase [Thioclava sp. BHET1]